LFEDKAMIACIALITSDDKLNLYKFLFLALSNDSVNAILLLSPLVLTTFLPSIVTNRSTLFSYFT